MSVCKVCFVFLLHALYVSLDSWCFVGQGLKFGSHDRASGVFVKHEVAIDRESHEVSNSRLLASNELPRSKILEFLFDYVVPFLELCDDMIYVALLELVLEEFGPEVKSP